MFWEYSETFKMLGLYLYGGFPFHQFNLYHFNWSQIVQYVKYTKYIKIAKEIAKCCDK